MNLSKAFGLFLAFSGILLWAGCGGPPTSGGTALEGVTPEAETGEDAQIEANWLTNYEQALARAAETEKRVLINFTGSDWCPPCMALQREVFATSAFKNYAAENLILLEIDFPFGKEQPNELVEQNHRLSQVYGIEGFPTLVLLDSDGEEVKRGGYRPGGPRVFFDWLDG